MKLTVLLLPSEYVKTTVKVKNKSKHNFHLSNIFMSSFLKRRKNVPRPQKDIHSRGKCTENLSLLTCSQVH